MDILFTKATLDTLMIRKMMKEILESEVMKINRTEDRNYVLLLTSSTYISKESFSNGM